MYLYDESLSKEENIAVALYQIANELQLLREEIQINKPKYINTQNYQLATNIEVD